MVQYSQNTVWYYINKRTGKIYATKMLFCYMVKHLKINSSDLDILGNIYDDGTYRVLSL